MTDFPGRLGRNLLAWRNAGALFAEGCSRRRAQVRQRFRRCGLLPASGRGGKEQQHGTAGWHLDFTPASCERDIGLSRKEQPSPGVGISSRPSAMSVGASLARAYLWAQHPWRVCLLHTTTGAFIRQIIPLYVCNMHCCPHDPTRNVVGCSRCSKL